MYRYGTVYYLQSTLYKHTNLCCDSVLEIAKSDEINHIAIAAVCNIDLIN